MTLRRYCARCSKFSISLILEDGRNITIPFEGKNVITKERFVDIEDEMIQKALEKTEAFNSYFYKSNEFDWMKEGDEINTDKITVVPAVVVDNLESKKSEEVKDNEKVEDTEDEKSTEGEESKINELGKKEFSTVSAAKSWLNKEHGISMAKLGNKTIVIEKALELGFEISFLNDN